MEERILLAVAEEMNIRGTKFTVDGVAARLGVSKKTIYQYFSSKDMLIESVVDMVLEELRAQGEAILQDRSLPFAEKLSAYLLTEPKKVGKTSNLVMSDIKKYRPNEWARIEEFRRQCAKRVAELLEEGIASGHVRPLNTQLAATMLLGAVGAFLQVDFLSKNHVPFSDALEALTKIFMFGVMKEKGELS